MIDLKELEKEIDAILEQETSESFLKWYEENAPMDLDSYLGNGDFIQLPHEEFILHNHQQKRTENRINVNNASSCNDSIDCGSDYQEAA